MKPCGHQPPLSTCRVCQLSQIDPRYQEAWKIIIPLVYRMTGGRQEIAPAQTGEAVQLDYGGSGGVTRNEAMNGILSDPATHEDMTMVVQGGAWRAVSLRGSSTIDFGTPTQRKTDVAVTITGLSRIKSTSQVQTFFIADSTADNDTDAHLIASRLVRLTVEQVTAGTGFTIRAMSEGEVHGTFNIRWNWR